MQNNMLFISILTNKSNKILKTLTEKLKSEKHSKTVNKTYT